jgi:SPP1 family phage portal protein
LQSDRLNDKEQFVNALLVIKGQILGDTDEQKREALDGLKENKVMELAADGEAAFLTRQFDESSVEVYKNSIVNDIHKISCVPDMSDQNFAGNVSGVAMKYKLLALEQLAKVKQRFFTEGLRYRLECISNFLRFKTTSSFDVGEIDISFRRSLPANELEQAQMVSMLNGIVPQEYLLSQIDFVSDPKKAMELIEEEKQAAEERAMQTQQALMNMEYNTPIKKSDV